MNKPFISICIPAYKNEDYVRRLLDSIAIQTFRDFEVIVTDDSRSPALQALCEGYGTHFPIAYFANETQLNTPENWNRAISHARGEWVKLVHDDDWFAGGHALSEFAGAARESKADFIFSGFYNVYADGSKKKFVMTGWERHLLATSPANLLKRNFIGHPSTTLVRNNREVWYDRQLKWVVDIEFYIRVLAAGTRYHIIPEPLMNLGIGSDQVTQAVFRKPEIEIPEQVELLRRIGPAALKRIFAYDYFWRFIRNLSVRNADVVAKYDRSGAGPPLLLAMIRQQAKLPAAMLRAGVISKLAMTVSYIWNRINNRMK
jgi:glycosyltransferase involved in cell wall biosynthesis